MGMSQDSINSEYLDQIDYELESALKKEGLTINDFNEICSRLKRSPNRTELGMFGVMWSEHCCYRNSKPLLSNFPTTGPKILVGPGENAGVVDIGHGQRVAFKIESHNHPSAIEPFQGAATGVGGILRDIFTMGARPIALLNALRFGPLTEPNNVGLVQGVVSGIAHYGNCVGVPTVGGEVSFHSSYTGNPLVNAMGIGLMETEEIVCSGATGPGNFVIYVGSTTGRDGMGGASFASSELSSSSIDDRPAVQVGDPFLEKGLIEACLDSFKKGDVIAAQDMGAAGLTCSCSEMAAKGGLGIELDLDLVPAREEGMTPYEYLLSESQERMLFVVKPGKEDDLMHKFKRWGLQAKIVGRVLEDNIVRVIHKKRIVAEIPANALADDTPVNYHNLIDSPPIEISEHWKWDESKLPKDNSKGINVIIDKHNVFKNWNEILLELLKNPNIASKEWIYNQYDYEVQLNTVIKPGKADAAVIRLRSQDDIQNNNNNGIAAVVDCLDRWVYLDPERGAIATVAESARNLSCVGAEPIAITNNLNFSSPETTTGYWQLANTCKGISKACKMLNTPVTGGNVSLYNDTRLANGSIKPIHPTPVIGMVGVLDNINQTIDQSWVNSGDEIWMLGASLNTIDFKDTVSLSASSYLEYIHGLITGRPPTTDLILEKEIQLFLRNLIKDNILNSAHDISHGGLAVTLAECCISSGLGICIDISASKNRLDNLLFSEGGSRIVVSVPSIKVENWKSHCLEWTTVRNDLPKPQYLGVVTANKEYVINYDSQAIIKLPLIKLKDSYDNSIPNRIQFS